MSEFVVTVRRGDPPRSDVEMQRDVFEQMQAFVRTRKEPVTDFVLSMASQLVAKDHIELGLDPVELTPHTVLTYFETARNKLADRAAVEPDRKSGW